MKIQALAAVSAFALLAACGQPAADKAAPAAGAAATATAVPTDLVAGVYTLDPNHASLNWSIQHLGLSNYTAGFDKLTGELTLDPASIANSKITLNIDPKSVDTNFTGDFRGTHPGTPYRSFEDEISRSPEMLNTDQHPTITFTSTAVEQTGPTTARVTGNLSFLGQTKPVTLDATFVGGAARHPMLNKPAVAFSATGTFKRSDFGMAASPLGDVVTVLFNGEFTQEAAAAAPAAAAPAAPAKAN